MTIREKYGFQSWEDIKKFFQELFEKSGTWTFVKPSGHPYRIEWDKNAEPYMDISGYDQRLKHLYMDLEELPFYEIMPTMDELYELIPKDSRNPAAYMRRLNNIYSIFSASYFTGAKNERDLSERCDYYENSGEMIAWLKEEAPKTLTLSDNIHKIKGEAFEDCSTPVRVVVPECVKTVEAEAFLFERSEIDYSNLLMIEILGENTELLGCPYSNYDGECFSEYPFIYIVAPEGSKAMQYAIDQEFPCATSMTEAIENLLFVGRELENTRDEVRGFFDTEVFLRKAELAVDYGLKNGADSRALIFGFCRIAFFVTDRIRDGYFDPKKAISYLIQYDLVEEYLMRDELEDENAWVRVLLALKKYDIHTYRKCVEPFLMQMDPDIAEDYVATLYGDANFNLEWGDMFSGGVTDEYEEGEFWALGAEIADLFIMNRLPKWKDIFEWCEDIFDSKSEADRYGYFSKEWVENMRGSVDEEEDED